jgi:hypothetical protein
LVSAASAPGSAAQRSASAASSSSSVARAMLAVRCARVARAGVVLPESSSERCVPRSGAESRVFLARCTQHPVLERDAERRRDARIVRRSSGK